MGKVAAVESMAGQEATTPEQLMGWLVSYGLDERGVSFELRTGRSFVTADRAASGRTVTIADRTVSSPHAAILVSREQPVLLQDVFSEQGTFLMRSGAGDEVRVTGPVELGHGDWVRFGKTVRFQVCLVNG